MQDRKDMNFSLKHTPRLIDHFVVLEGDVDYRNGKATRRYSENDWLFKQVTNLELLSYYAWCI